MPAVYLSKKQVKLLYDLIDNQTMLGQCEYTDDEWNDLENLILKMGFILDLG